MVGGLSPPRANYPPRCCRYRHCSPPFRRSFERCSLGYGKWCPSIPSGRFSRCCSGRRSGGGTSWCSLGCCAPLPPAVAAAAAAAGVRGKSWSRMPRGLWLPRAPPTSASPTEATSFVGKRTTERDLQARQREVEREEEKDKGRGKGWQRISIPRAGGCSAARYVYSATVRSAVLSHVTLQKYSGGYSEIYTLRVPGYIPEYHITKTTRFGTRVFTRVRPKQPGFLLGNLRAPGVTPCQTHPCDTLHQHRERCPLCLITLYTGGKKVIMSLCCIISHRKAASSHSEGLRGSVVVEQETREVACDVDVHGLVRVYVELALILSIPCRRRAVASPLLLLSPADSRSIRHSPRLKGE